MKRIVLLLTLFITFNTFAAYFSSTNNNTDKNCPKWEVSRFKDIELYFTTGVSGAMKFGYTYEVPIKRGEVNAIWCALEPIRGAENKICNGIVDLNSDRPFKKYAGKMPNRATQFTSFIDLEDQLNIYTKYIAQTLKADRISHPNVGAVLEVLSRYYLQEMSDTYPKDTYRIVSGVEYRKKKGQNTIGELDIIVYNRQSCEVVALGESKASSVKSQKRSLAKAKKQLARFRNFIN